MDIDWDKATEEQHIKNLDDYANGDSYQRSVEWAVDEIKSLRQQLAEQAIIKANLCESLQEVTHLAINYIRWKGGMSDGSDDRAIEQAQSLIKAQANG